MILETRARAATLELELELELGGHVYLSKLPSGSPLVGLQLTPLPLECSLVAGTSLAGPHSGSLSLPLIRDFF